jgi:GT2 family glycosyltransferase
VTTIVIPTLDPESEMVKACVRAISEGPHADTYRLVVQHDEHRDGFASTCNLGAKETADTLVFLNDDTIPQPGWLEGLVGAAESHGIAGSRLLYPDGTVQHSGVFLRRHVSGLVAYNRRKEAPSGEVPAVTGACLAIRRDLWDELGGFDEAFVNGYEDVDLCLRARQSGHAVWYCADSTVIHLESQSPGRFDHARQNIDLLQQRWGHLPI